ncbi:UDP-N-acetylglucosamine 2-epimerase (non-hydrolyzing) [bacterium]|nr:UDP-N-acetylglucosamine 2-epimerase (non-hydrolyzing) [bacterium]
MPVLKLLFVVGSRPQFPKVAAVARAIARHNASGSETQIEHCLVHTGQHYDDSMNDVFFRELELRKPDYNLEVGSGSIGYQTGASIERIYDTLGEWQPDWVVVFGDTNATLAGGIAAQQRHLRLAHVEAGIRTGNLHQAEELNRVIVDRIADLRFAATAATLNNLWQENLSDNSFFVGDTMLDNYMHFLPQRKLGYAATLGLKPGHYIYSTVHRAENTDYPERLGAIIDTLIGAQNELMPVVLPMHPRTRAAIERLGRTGELEAAGVKVIDPIGFNRSQALVEDCYLVYSDSGGLLREACFSGHFCVIPWEYTTFPEINEIGMANCGRVVKDEMLKRLFDAPGPQERESITNFGNGTAGEQVVAKLVELIG